jgi:replicative DNA helicase
MSDPEAPDFREIRPRRKPPEVTKVDRLPPHSPEGEQALLSCIIQDPIRCLPQATERFGRTHEVFYDLRHQTIFQCMVEMQDKLTTIDTVTLYQTLRDKNLADEIGGIAYLGALADVAMSTAALPEYLDIVHGKYLLREMVQRCTACVSSIYTSEAEPMEIIDKVERSVLEVRRLQSSKSMTDIHELVKGAINRIEDYHQGQGKIFGLGTGFTDLDRMTGGLEDSQMIVIAGRPSMGKTSLAMNIADHVAVELKEPVGVFSLEMTAEQLTMRMLCSRARVNLRNVREGFLAERDFPKITAAAGRLANCPLHIDDSKGLSITQLRAKARRMMQQYGIKLFVVDYLQLLHDEDNARKRNDSRQQEVANISAGVKNMAGELKVPVMILSQLNRELDKEKNRKPRMSDLRESGAIEQDADTIGFLYKPNSDSDEEEDKEVCSVNLLIAKQRNGPQDENVHLTFLKSFTRFESAAKVSDSDVPEQETMAYKQPFKD